MANESHKKMLHLFRMVGIAEGASFLVLVLIGMPMKYLLKIPEVVKYVGMAHGLLFVSYIYFAFHLFSAFKKPVSFVGKAFLASIIPFGTFIFDRQLKKEAALL